MKQEPRPVSAGNPRPSGRGEVNAGSTRQQAIDAIAEALGNSGYLGGIVGLTKLAEAAHDAVEPLIRADQREQDAQLAEHVSAAYPPPRCEHPEHWNRHGLNPFGALLRAQP